MILINIFTTPELIRVLIKSLLYSVLSCVEEDNIMYFQVSILWMGRGKEYPPVILINVEHYGMWKECWSINEDPRYRYQSCH